MGVWLSKWDRTAVYLHVELMRGRGCGAGKQGAHAGLRSNYKSLLLVSRVLRRI